jgi:alpha-L-fucosidase 2
MNNLRPILRMGLLTCLVLLSSCTLIPKSEDFGNPHIAESIEQYNVVWDSPSQSALGSMPVGNGDIGLNVWVEESGDLLFYIGKSDAWSGNSRLLKLGRIRIQLTPNPFINGVPFKQTLDLFTGTIDIEAGEGENLARLSLWVDANQPVVRLEVDSKTELEMKVSLEIWRTEKRLIAPANIDDNDMERGESFSAFGVTGPYAVYQYPDEVMPAMDNRITWFHRNEYSTYPWTMELQGMGDMMDTFPDPLLNHTFGGTIEGKGLNSLDDKTLGSKSPQRKYELSLYFLSEQTESVEAWREKLDQTLANIEKTDRIAARTAHDSWWKEFWERSWIHVSGNKEADLVSQAYQLQRYINACGGRGAYPIHFNGSIFTIDMLEDWSVIPEPQHFDPDYRRWGSCYWFNNTRAIYWSFLAAGDFDLIQPFFQLYRNVLPLAKVRTPRFFQHEGAFFPETITFWGTWQNEIYGWDREGKPPGYVKNRYLRYHLSGGLELSSMMLDYYALTLDKEFLDSTLLPIVSSVIEFYDNHYDRNEDGKIHFYPAQALETWWDCDNPLPVIAGLKFVIKQLLILEETNISDDQLAAWKRFLTELPELPTREVNGDKILAPAQRFAELHNTENAETWAIHPYRLYGVGKPDLEMARKTFDYRLFKVMENERPGYHPDPIQAAYLGLPELAGKYVYDYFNYSDSTVRFKGFYKAADDWFPNQQTGNTAMTALQKMIMQTEGERIIMLPAWPEEWDMSFKLHAPFQTTVEGEYKNGKLDGLKVRPEHRSKDIEFAGDLLDKK